MTKEVRVIIAGCRNFTNYTKAERYIHKIFLELTKEGILSGKINEDAKCITIISGNAKGADTLGEKFAENYNINLKLFPAKWDDLTAKPCVIRNRYDGSQYNVLAGLNRNSEMAQYASESEYGVLIAFWDNKSTGTKNMIDVADKRKLRVFVENI